jgi:hypothetical protein
MAAQQMQLGPCVAEIAPLIQNNSSPSCPNAALEHWLMEADRPRRVPQAAYGTAQLLGPAVV